MDATPFPRPHTTCSHCQAPLPVGAQFCVYCGVAVAVPAGGPHPVQVNCPVCATRYPESYRFCAKDGAALRLITG